MTTDDVLRIVADEQSTQRYAGRRTPPCIADVADITLRTGST